MKEKVDKKHLSADKDFVFPESEFYDNLELVVSEYEEENFYSFSGDDNNEPDKDKLER